MSQRNKRAERARVAARAATVAAERAREAERLAVAVLTAPAPEPEPFAHRFATYGGDVTAALAANPIVGPNELGERLAVVYAHFDSVENKTRVGFRYATVHDIRAQLAREIAAARANDARRRGQQP